MKIILKTARKNKRSVLWMYNRPLKLLFPFRRGIELSISRLMLLFQLDYRKRL